MNLKRIFSAFSGLILALVATPALADTISLDASDIGTTYTFDYNGFKDSTEYSDLSSTMTVTLTAIDGDTYSFDYTVENTTSGTAGSRVSSFGFNTDPEITDAAATGSYSYATLASSYPNGIGAIDVCFKDASTGSCAGGGSGGLTTGQSGSGAFTLTFADAVDSVTLGDFYVRYQSVTGINGVTSASGEGTLTSTTSTSSGTQVPEPGMLGMLAMILIALGLVRTRSRRSSASSTGMTPAFA